MKNLFKWLFLFALIQCANAQPSVALAGLAYSGDAQTLDARFPYSRRFEKILIAEGLSVNKILFASLEKNKPSSFNITQQNNELKGADQVISVALVINNEVVSTEQFGDHYKVLIQVRAQAIFFDFKSMSIIRSYPFSLAYLDILNDVPKSKELDNRFRDVYLGVAGKSGILDRFAQALKKADLPTNVPRFVQIAKVNVNPTAMAALTPAQRTSKAAAETWVADMLSEAISGRVGIPILPYAKGYAIGKVMALTVADGNVFNLTLPEPDYTIEVSFNNVRKIKTGQSVAGESFVYGAYATVKIEEPVSGTTYLNSDFKNGEVKVVPVTQETVDDAPAYADAIRGLFTKLSDAMAGKSSDWLSDAASAKDISKQISSTIKLLQLCK